MRNVLVLLIVTLAMLAGCTMVETPSEHARRVTNIMDLNMRMAAEDLDYILLLDKNSRLNQWHVRTGY
jgi:uncharacterized protein YceK